MDGLAPGTNYLVWDGSQAASRAVFQLMAAAHVQQVLAACALLRACADQWHAFEPSEAVTEANRLEYEWLGDGEVLCVYTFVE